MNKNNIKIEIGDRVTYKSGKDQRQVIMTNEEQIENYESNVLIIKIERIGINGWYTVYEKEDKKELLTNEEKEFLEIYFKMIKDFKEYKINYIYITLANYLHINHGKDYEYSIEVNSYIFMNLKREEQYTLAELGLNN